MAAVYLKEEMMGSEFLSYSLLLIFFIQTLMAIFLHIRTKELNGEAEKLAVQNVYHRLSLFLLISLLSFLHLVIILREQLFNLQLDIILSTPQQQDTLNVWNLIFVVSPFRLMLDILLAIGLIISLPVSIVQMWNIKSNNEE